MIEGLEVFRLFLDLAVDRLEADLKIKKRILEDAKALTGAQVAAEIKLEVAQANHDMYLASLEEARWNLRETTVRAPHDGVVTQLGELGIAAQEHDDGFTVQPGPVSPGSVALIASTAAGLAS